MYDWWCARIPARWVQLGYACWYALLMGMVLYLADRPMTDFYYLHG